MISRADGVEVVETRADAARLPMPPLLIVDSVTSFLDAHDIGEGPISWRRIGDGQSNITYLIRRGEEEWVLRRGPRPPLARSTHDMLREATVQRALKAMGRPVPKINAVCDDTRVLGVPFYVMEHLDGHVLATQTPPAFDTPEQRRRISEVLVDTLIDLHSVDLEQAGLSSFGQRSGYLERQVRTFTRLAGQVTSREMPLREELSVWLEAHMPTTRRTTLVHGDYRLGNVMLARDAPPSMLAVLDWEMATLGDPLADLGYFLVTYSDPSSPGTILEFAELTREEGYLTRAEIVERYARATHANVDGLFWYQVLALWKASVFLEEMFTRWRAGERPGDEFAPLLERAVPQLLESARNLARL